MLKKYFIAYSVVLIDVLLVATFVNRMKKSDKHFKLVSLTSILRVLFMRFELSPNPPPPRYNISNGSYDQYAVEVTGSFSQ